MNMSTTAVPAYSHPFHRARIPLEIQRRRDAFAPLPSGLCSTPSAEALPFSRAVVIHAAAEVDHASTSHATQSGILTRIQGGALTQTVMADPLSMAGHPLVDGPLSDLGDGVGFSFSRSGDVDSADDLDDGLFGCYCFSLVNTSFTDRFKITLAVDFSHTVHASGRYAFSQGLLSLFRTEDPTEIFFFTDLESDTVFGNRFNSVVSTGEAFGGTLSERKTQPLDFLLEPGETLSLSGRHHLRGGAFAMDDFGVDSRYSSVLNALITIAAVENLTTPPIRSRGRN
ncbi:MAG: hypothetical protein LM522_01320 [Candidatus Contendobacter sp.]|nr:hypothetical protein [Candidatus Contendobacter sp.]